MTNQKNTSLTSKQKTNVTCHTTSGAIYGLGLIGAAIYYIQNAVNFWDGAYGILKAFVWPAILVYKALELLNL